MTLTGTIENIRYQNQENGWAAITVRKPDGSLIAASGIMAGVKKGINIQMKGEIEITKFGPSFKANTFQEVRPSDMEGIYKYLSSGLIKYIGPVFARKIVDTFGENTLNILDNSPERLNEIKGVGNKRIKSVIESIKDQKAIRNIMIWLKRYNLSNTLAVKIYKTYGDDSVDKLQENPYRLYRDIKGVGFKKADETAIKLGIPKEHEFRIQAGILAVLEDWAQKEGGTYMPSEMLTEKAASEDYLGLSKDNIDAILDNDIDVIIDKKNNISLPVYHVAENIIAEKLLDIKTNGLRVNDKPNFQEMTKKTGLSYSPEQKSAICLSLSSPVMILTGGPGTGKTATMNAIITEMENRKWKVVLAAPTGRAAKRMNEVSGHEAKTIHRLLEYKQGEFQRNKNNPIAANVVIIDETSMIDTILMKNLLNAVSPKSKLILIGDSDQLPPVGAGCPLRDIIASGVVNCTRLHKVFRQAQGSDIVMNAHAINEGKIPSLDNKTGTDFFFAKMEETLNVQQRILTAIENMVNKKIYELDEIQVLTPMRREWDPIGCIQMNRVIQNKFNPDGIKVAGTGQQEFRTGDRVMVIKNDYEKDVFNGDIGTVIRKGTEQDIDPEDDNDRVPIIMCSFEGRTVPFYQGDIEELDLAYACTVHKSQGSEYKCVIMPIHTSHFIMLKRNLVYTAITRAKKCFLGVGTPKALAMAIKTEDTKKRYTLLREKLTNTQHKTKHKEEDLFKQER